MKRANMKMHAKPGAALALLLAATLSLAACGSDTSGGGMEGAGHGSHRQEQEGKELAEKTGVAEHGSMGHGSGETQDMETIDARTAGVGVEFASDPAAPEPGQPATLSYRITDEENGRTVTDLPIDHERPMHLIYVSKDLEQFRHVHPKVGSRVAYAVMTEFLEAGTYVLYDEFKYDGRTVLDRRELTVGQAQETQASITPDLSPRTAEGVTVALAAPETVRAGEEASFAFTLTRDGRPVTDLEPYLGAAAHVAIVSADTQEFVHTHGEATGGDAHGADGNVHEGDEGMESGMESSNSGDAELGSEITFHHTFPSAGLYKVWGQFNRDGRVITVPYVIEVEENRQEEIAAKGAEVMPFDLEETTHVFEKTQAGGVQKVVADDPSDTKQVTLIREHLEKETAAFRRGDLSDPSEIHGEEMPGLKLLETGAEDMEIRYSDLHDGAKIEYESGDPALVAALHDWFDAQSSDHGEEEDSGANGRTSDHGGHDEE